MPLIDPGWTTVDDSHAESIPIEIEPEEMGHLKFQPRDYLILDDSDNEQENTPTCTEKSYQESIQSQLSKLEYLQSNIHFPPKTSPVWTTVIDGRMIC